MASGASRPGGPRAGSTPWGPVSAVFKADGAESDGRYSISEWWLDPHTKGPGPHSHPDDDVFYVLAGTLSVGTTHDFENRGDERAGMLNVSAPGDFEDRMPAIAQWFRDRSPDDARA
jgi:mannose-6-phosphate isomerase-like protein (cupin superfamily)